MKNSNDTKSHSIFKQTCKNIVPHCVTNANEHATLSIKFSHCATHQINQLTRPAN